MSGADVCLIKLHTRIHIANKSSSQPALKNVSKYICFVYFRIIGRLRATFRLSRADIQYIRSENSVIARDAKLYVVLYHVNSRAQSRIKATGLISIFVDNATNRV